MSKQDTIISLLKEIDENIDNVNNSEGTNANLKELTITSNGIYTPQEGVDGFSKVTAEFDTSSLPKISILTITAGIKNLDYWTDFGLLDTSRVTKLSSTFAGGEHFKKIDVTGWDTSNVTYAGYVFQNNYALTEIDLTGWNMSKCNNSTYLITGCHNLISIIGDRTIDEVLNNNISCLTGLRSADFNLITSPKLNRASLRALINGLADLTGTDAQTLTIGETLIAKLTEEDIAIATAKNWTIA